MILDAHQGLAAAVRRWLPGARRQRCTMHLERNVLTKLPRRLRPRVAREVAAVFTASSLAEARTQLARLTGRWGQELPEAMACLADGFAAATVFYAFPAAHWKRIGTTNALERLHGEIKRRTKAVGAFPDRASALRLITAVALKVTTIWGEAEELPQLLHKTRDLTVSCGRQCARGGLEGYTSDDIPDRCDPEDSMPTARRTG